jgi:hypothetical protein
MNDVNDLVGEDPAAIPPAVEAKIRRKRREYDDINPQNRASTLGSAGTPTRSSRVPMSVPQQRLAVPEIPGYHLHWMIGDQHRIQAALRAGYEFVDEGETSLSDYGLGNSEGGNSDLGSRVSVLASRAPGDDGSSQRLYLMKIRQEWFDEDQAALEARNEQIAATLRGGEVSGGEYGNENRYIPQAHRNAVANLFTPKRGRR